MRLLSASPIDHPPRQSNRKLPLFVIKAWKASEELISKLLVAPRYPFLAVLLAGTVACAYLRGNMLGEPPIDRVLSGWPMHYLNDSTVLLYPFKRAGNLVLFPLAFIALLEAFRGAARLLSRPFGPEAPAAVRRLAADRYSFVSVLLASLAGSYIVFQNMYTYFMITTGWPLAYISSGYHGPVEYSRALLWANVVLFPLILLVVCQAAEMVVRPVRGHRRPTRKGELFAATITGGAVGAAIYTSVVIGSELIQVALWPLIEFMPVMWPRSVIYFAAAAGAALWALQTLSRGAMRDEDESAEMNIS